MKKRFPAVIIAIILFALLIPKANAVSLKVANTTVQNVKMNNGTTYVPIRQTSQLLGNSVKVSWENGQAIVRASGVNVTARPGDCYIEANGRMLYAAEGVKLVNGSTLVPIRPLAAAFGASVYWDGATSSVSVSRGSGTIASSDAYYDSSEVYWLSRIIHAESESEPLKGKIAVGNVVLNRVKSPGFPSTIYTVIFDTKGGVQFTPVANGAIYNSPSAESIVAAKLCLDGASVAGNSLFFFNPAISTSSWIKNSRSYVCAVGNHLFYA